MQNLGGSTSKQKIKESIVADNSNNLTYKDVFEPVVSVRSKNKYSIKGRKINYQLYPTQEDKQTIDNYWANKHANYKLRKSVSNPYEESSIIEDDGEESDGLVKFEDLSAKLLDMIKAFSPKKFESFSRKLLAKMGIIFNESKGITMSNDHGIDGYGIFVSDEYKTNKVVIQCKRFTKAVHYRLCYISIFSF